MEKRKKLIVKGVEVDVQSLYEIAHRCDPESCGCKGRCCRSYEIPVSESELDRIVGLLPDLCQRLRGLKQGGQYEDFFEEDEEEEFVLIPRPDGRCRFAYSRKGALRCALHSLALKQGLKVSNCKPWACLLWPLALSPGKIPQLGLQAGAYEFPCNQRRVKLKEAKLDSGVREILEEVFGLEFTRRVERSGPK
ncbi:MAG: DUF3109 family protein [Planctomycetes bacterium]|nr:DUF3109 family protein [Planctomycetota bacterium]